MSGIGLDTGLMTTGQFWIENYWNIELDMHFLNQSQCQPQKHSVDLFMKFFKCGKEKHGSKFHFTIYYTYSFLYYT